MKPASLASTVGWLLVCGMLAVGGCETAPQNDAELAQARGAVADAVADPNVSKYAPIELERARKLLIDAESAANDQGASRKTAAHYAYLATQMARIAAQRAHEQVAVAHVQAAQSERQQILLSAHQNQVQDAQTQTESQRLAAQFQELQAAQTSRGIVLTLDDVSFDTGRAALKSGASRSLDQIAQFLAQHAERRVQIEGFTDSDGPNDYNLELSQSRADAVAMAIIHRGIDAQRVRATGYGEAFPVASNRDDGSRQLNRRVEIIVSNGEQAIPCRTAASTP